MGRRIDADQLVGAGEIAERLGLAWSESVGKWVQRYPDFPKPLATLKMGKVWYWPDVEKWARDREHGSPVAVSQGAVPLPKRHPLAGCLQGWPIPHGRGRPLVASDIITCQLLLDPTQFASKSGFIQCGVADRS